MALTTTKELIELRKLAEAANTTSEQRAEMRQSYFEVAYDAMRKFEKAVTPPKVIALLDHIEALSAEVERLQYEVDAVPAIKEERDHFQALAKDNGSVIIKTSCELADTKKERDQLRFEVVEMLQGYADSYKLMAKMGDGKVLAGNVAVDIERNMIHAAIHLIQPKGEKA